MNRGERRAVDKDVKRSINAVKSHLAYLNAVGEPQYELRVISPFKSKLKRILRIK